MAEDKKTGFGEFDSLDDLFDDDINLDESDEDESESSEDSSESSDSLFSLDFDEDSFDSIEEDTDELEEDTDELEEEQKEQGFNLDDIDSIDIDTDEIGDDAESESVESNNSSNNTSNKITGQDIDFDLDDIDDFADFDTIESSDTNSSKNIGSNRDKNLNEMSEDEINSLSSDELAKKMAEMGIDVDDADSNIDEDTLDNSNDSDVSAFGDLGVELETVDEAMKEMESLGADHDGTILSGDSLLTDDFDTVNKDADFISDTGEIVVMDESENGDNFKFQYIDIEKIAIVKRIRKNNTNVEDLVQSIKSTGLLEPLVVAPTATDGFYVLLAGFRRIMACAKAGKRRIPCIINLKVNVPEIPVLEALYNHSKKYTIKEIVDYIDYLEKDKGIMSASMIEYLLQLNSGDYTKLKDILNDNDDDIVSKLMDGIYTIELAFKKLEQRRKKESAEEKENKKAARVYEDEEESGANRIESSGEEMDDGEGLTEEEIKELAFGAGDLGDADEEDMQEMLDEGNNVEGFQPHKQDYKDRERLDPALRKSVLSRDENTCKFCNMGGQEYSEVLDVHHLVEVYLGGDDSIENLVTACTCCHKLIHLYGRGELFIRPIDELSESEQKKFKRIIKAGNLIRKGMAAKGLKREHLKKMDNAETIGRTKPGTGQVAG